MPKKDKKVQHLNVFLMKKKCMSFEDALRAHGVAGVPRNLTELGFESALYLPAVAESRPGWVHFLDEGFGNLDITANRMATALLFVKVNGRIFALTFGHVRQFLDQRGMERDFGLRVVVNRVDQHRIRSISLRMFRDLTVKRREEASRATGLRTFGVDVRQDLLRAVTGVPSDKSFANRISGADSCAIDVPLKFNELGKKCKELLKAYEDDEYKKRGFDWIENMRVVRDPSLVLELDLKLVEALQAKATEIQIVCPEHFDRVKIIGFKYQDEDRSAQLHTELETREWFDAIDDHLNNLTVEMLHERRVLAYDVDGFADDAIEHDVFVFEAEIKGKKYILSGGEWFEVSLNFDKAMTDYISRIEKSAVALPKATDGHTEDDYVTHVDKTEIDLMTMHNATLVLGGTPVEACDLLSKRGHLIHVKRWSASSTFSHLLAQGAVSAESLVREPKFRAHVRAKAGKHRTAVSRLFPEKSYVPGDLKVVYALIRRSRSPLPFFSRLNLMREVERVERLGYAVAYQRIEVE